MQGVKWGGGGSTHIYIHDGPLKHVFTGETTEQVMSPNGLSFHPQHSLSTLPPLTYLLIPGGEGTDKVCDDKELLAKLGGLVTQAEAVLTVCTGAFILQVCLP